MRREAAQRAEDALASRPEPLPLRSVRRRSDLHGVEACADALYVRGLLLDRLRQAVNLNQQHGLRPGRVACVDGGLRGLDT